MPQLNPEYLELLRQISSCSIANAILNRHVIPRNEGYMSPDIKSIFPDMAPMIGYAVTAVITADMPPSKDMNVSRLRLIEEIIQTPEPRIVVIKDLDYPNVVGSFWGEVQANIHGSVAVSYTHLRAHET